MRSRQFSLLALMILVAVTAILAWLARSDTGRISLFAAGIVIGGLIVGGWFSRGIDLLFDRLGRGRRE
jgi:hypothetical protein